VFTLISVVFPLKQTLLSVQTTLAEAPFLCRNECRNDTPVFTVYLALEIKTAKVGLKINEQKTKYMIAGRNDRTICDVGQSVAIGEKHFKAVKEFVYLGSLMTPTNDVSLEIQRRIQTVNRCFLGLGEHLQSSHLLPQTKFTIPMICPVLLYGSET
jgi:hypothetical protein